MGGGGQGRGAKGMAPRGWRCGEGMSPCLLGRGLRKGQCPLPRNFFSIFGVKIFIVVAFWMQFYAV